MRLIAIGLVMAIVAIVLCHRRGDPVVVDYREDDDGVQPYDPWTSNTYRAPDGTQWSWTA